MHYKSLATGLQIPTVLLCSRKGCTIQLHGRCVLRTVLLYCCAVVLLFGCAAVLLC